MEKKALLLLYPLVFVIRARVKTTTTTTTTHDNLIYLKGIYIKSNQSRTLRTFNFFSSMHQIKVDRRATLEIRLETIFFLAAITQHTASDNIWNNDIRCPRRPDNGRQQQQQSVCSHPPPACMNKKNKRYGYCPAWSCSIFIADGGTAPVCN